MCAAGEAWRWFETVIAFACLCRCGVETAVAFAGEKWAFLVQFSDAEVMPVSMVPSWGRAEASSVSTLRCFYVLCAKLVALLGLAWVRARNSSPSALKTPHIRRFWACWASFFAETPLEGQCRANFFARPDPAPRSCCRRGDIHVGDCGGFAALGTGCRHVTGVSDPHVVQFPPIGHGESPT